MISGVYLIKETPFFIQGSAVKIIVGRSKIFFDQSN
jgi:hypothetical protein